MKILILVLIFLGVKAADIKDLIDGNRRFTQALYSDTPKWNTDLDVLLSPFSIQTVLALTQSGAKSTTAEEIRSTAFLPPTFEETESAMQHALSTMETKISNKVYVESGFSTNEDFKTVAKNIYQSSFQSVEFINSATAANTINEWAGEQTSNKFGDYFAWGGDFNKLSKDLLVNTLSLKKNWSIPFETSQTKVEYFYGPNNNRYSVNMMTQGPFLYNYHESAELDAKFLEMPLGENISFTIVLPNSRDGLAKVEKKIDLVFTVPDYVQEFIQLSFPRTTIQTTYLNLRSSLERLGIKNAWHNDEADLSGMAGVPGELAAHNLIHDTHINIDERGIEAAAGGLVNVRVPSTKHFEVNHPFLFYIKVNEIIVFVGKVSNPVYTIHH